MKKIILLIMIFCTSCSLGKRVANGVYTNSEKCQPSDHLLVVRDTNFMFISVWGNYTTLGRGTFKQKKNYIHLIFEDTKLPTFKQQSHTISKYWPYTQGLVTNKIMTLKVKGLGKRFDSIPTGKKKCFQEACDFLKSDSVYTTSIDW